MLEGKQKRGDGREKPCMCVCVCVCVSIIQILSFEVKRKKKCVEQLQSLLEQDINPLRHSSSEIRWGILGGEWRS